MKKKIVSVFLLVTLVLSLTACGSKGDSNSPTSKSFSAKDLSIDDFKWETKSSKCDGDDCYVLSLTNNSKFDVIGVVFYYQVKNDVSESDLSIFDDFMSDHDGYIEEDDSPKDVTLRGDKETLISQGEQLTDIRFTVGFKEWAWYDYPTDEQFNLMEPKELQLGIVSGNKLYIAYYDFINKSWKLDEETAVVDTWSTKEIANKLSKPNVKHYVVTTDEEDEFEVTAYGVTEDKYNEYVETLKSSGFVQDESYTSHFEGTNSDGYSVDVWYYETEQSMSIGIEKED